MVSACLEACRATSDVWWYEQAQRAFDWFLGWNDLGLEIYSPTTGGCRDALHVDRVNQNQGAESTLAFLLSLAEMQLMHNAVTVFHPPLAPPRSLPEQPDKASPPSLHASERSERGVTPRSEEILVPMHP